MIALFEPLEITNRAVLGLEAKQEACLPEGDSGMNLQKNRWMGSLFLAFACVALGGCGGVYDSTVKGVVTLDGNPVVAGAVAFIPSGGGSLAYARTDQSGRYKVFTGNEVGMPSGQYGVTVVAREAPKETHSKLGGPPPPGKRITPPWYGSSKSSPLNYNVEPGSNVISLELTSEPPPGWNPPKGRRRSR